jgi:hypothetical protein
MSSFLPRFFTIAVIPGAAKRTRNDGKVSKHNGVRKLLLSQRCKSNAFARLIHLIGVQERSQLLESTAEKLHFVPALRRNPEVLPGLFEKLQPKTVKIKIKKNDS